MKIKLLKGTTECVPSIFHNNVLGLNHNLKSLKTSLLHEYDFNFNIAGVTETKLTNANEQQRYKAACSRGESLKTCVQNGNKEKTI